MGEVIEPVQFEAAVVAVVERVPQHAHRPGIVACHHERTGLPVRDPGLCLAEIVLMYQRCRPADLIEARADPGHPVRLSELHQRRRHKFVVAELLTGLERPAAPFPCGLVIGRGAPEIGEIAVRAAKLPARPERLQQFDCELAGLPGCVDVARAPEIARESPESDALRAPVAGRPVALDRVAERGDRLRVLVGE